MVSGELLFTCLSRDHSSILSPHFARDLLVLLPSNSGSKQEAQVWSQVSHSPDQSDAGMSVRLGLAQGSQLPELLGEKASYKSGFQAVPWRLSILQRGELA